MQNNIARRSRDIARKSRDIARRSRDIARRSRDIARRSRDIACRSRDIARRSRYIVAEAKRYRVIACISKEILLAEAKHIDRRSRDISIEDCSQKQKDIYQKSRWILLVAAAIYCHRRDIEILP